MKTAGNHSKKPEVPVKGVRSTKYFPFRDLERKKKIRLSYGLNCVLD